MQNTTLSRVEIEDRAIVDPLVYAMASRDSDVLDMVRDALAARRTQLAFLPVFTTNNPQTTAFHEGLVRLTDEEGRIIPAAHFMQRVEENGLGRQIDCVMLELAFQCLRSHPELRLSVNVSARSIGDGEWRRILDRGLLDRGQPGDRLIFEISETSAMLLHENVIRFMAEMQPKGVCFALDGFGAGMTAFRHLKDFFFDLVKIDKSFVRGIDHDSDNQVLAEALITVAHQFEMFAVADGVETAGEAAFLRGLGVDCLQGYHFGVPSLQL
ncbi:EAL domain-containing protein [Loktanella sp. Alg231-35]|uniref:EAL domain-containing protein n=1 Tax=Loktanella sp. Alg231-35 TaxID=1922220 RepID=UPI000D558ADE|nr:EAL domain-containing protein [Loktanella sp. Alg231-35]